MYFPQFISVPDEARTSIRVLFTLRQLQIEPWLTGRFASLPYWFIVRHIGRGP